MTQIATREGQGFTRRMADPYKVYWQTDNGPSALEFTLDQLSTWLREKGVEVDLDQDVYKRGDGYRFICMHHRAGWRHDVQARLVETKSNGTWTTELTLSSTDREGGWVRLSVSSSDGIFAGTPRLARYMLESGLFRDGGSLQLTPKPKYVSIGQVEELAEVLTDMDRQGLVLVAGSGEGLDFDAWSQRVNKWTRDITGLAEAFVLDPLATQELARILGVEYATKPFTLRTYKPGVDPASPAGWRRHRYISTKRLSESSVPGISRLLGRIAREHNAARPLPESAKAVFKAFSRLENRVLAKSLLEKAPEALPQVQDVGAASTGSTEELGVGAGAAVDLESVSGEVEEYTRQVALVRRVLGIDIISEENLARFTKQGYEEGLVQAFQQELDDVVAQREALQDEVTEVRLALDEAQLELDYEAHARSDAEDEARWLRDQLAQLQRWDIVHATLPEEQITQYPDSFEELVIRLLNGEVPGVVFTGDRATTEELDTHDGLDTAVRSAWEACLALADYVRFRGEGNNCDVFHYLKSAPAGYRTVSLGKFAPRESEPTMNSPKTAQARLLPVPKGVDPSGAVKMFAHFKCALVGLVSPRLHYHDDVSRSGAVYVGYIGRHLPTMGAG